MLAPDTHARVSLFPLGFAARGSRLQDRLYAAIRSLLRTRERCCRDGAGEELELGQRLSLDGPGQNVTLLTLVTCDIYSLYVFLTTCAAGAKTVTVWRGVISVKPLRTNGEKDVRSNIRFI